MDKWGDNQTHNAVFVCCQNTCSWALSAVHKVSSVTQPSEDAHFIPLFFFFDKLPRTCQVQKYPFCPLFFFLVMHGPFVPLLFSEWSVLLKSLFQQRFPSVEFVECFLIEHDWTEEKEMLQRHKIVLNPISFTSDPLWHQMCEVKTVSEVNYTSFYSLSSPKPNILLHARLACKGHNENTVPLGVAFTIKPVSQ